MSGKNRNTRYKYNINENETNEDKSASKTERILILLIGLLFIGIMLVLFYPTIKKTLFNSSKNKKIENVDQTSLVITAKGINKGGRFKIIDITHDSIIADNVNIGTSEYSLFYTTLEGIKKIRIDVSVNSSDSKIKFLEIKHGNKDILKNGEIVKDNLMENGSIEIDLEKFQ